MPGTSGAETTTQNSNPTPCGPRRSSSPDPPRDRDAQSRESTCRPRCRCRGSPTPASDCATTAGACSPTRTCARHSPIPTAASRAARSSFTSPATWTGSSGRSTACRSRAPSRSCFTYGERVRFVLVNDTMMEHPIHLHGMWSDLEDERGEFLVRKHTISVPPGTKRSFRVTADALGRWAFHCHLLYHMTAGMFREVRVEEGVGAARGASASARARRFRRVSPRRPNLRTIILSMSHE